MAKKKTKTISKTANGNGQAKATSAPPPKLSASKKQLEIKGAERPVENKELEKLVLSYASSLYQRMDLERQEPALRDAIFDKMQELKLPIFVAYDGEAKYEVKAKMIDPKKKVSVKRHEVHAG